MEPCRLCWLRGHSWPVSGKNNKEEGLQRWIKQVMHALASRTPSVIDCSTLPLRLVQGTKRSGFCYRVLLQWVPACRSPHNSCGVSVGGCSTDSLWFSKTAFSREERTTLPCWPVWYPFCARRRDIDSWARNGSQAL